MKYIQQSPTILVVDMKSVIAEHMERHSLYEFFIHFNLTDIIETILSVSTYIDYSDVVYDAIDRHFSDIACDGLDMDMFTIFYECLMHDVDAAIVEQYQLVFSHIEDSSWIFESWISDTTLIVRLEI